jgi:cytochrome c oxidase subunit 4
VTTETATATGHADDAHDAAHDEQHGASDRTYIMLAVLLGVFTAAEVSLHYIDTGPVHIPALMILMVLKFVVVVSYFMHLKWEQRLFKALFYAGVYLAIGVYIVALTTFHFWG